VRKYLILVILLFTGNVGATEICDEQYLYPENFTFHNQTHYCTPEYYYTEVGQDYHNVWIAMCYPDVMEEIVVNLFGEESRFQSWLTISFAQIKYAEWSCKFEGEITDDSTYPIDDYGQAMLGGSRMYSGKEVGVVSK